MTYRVVQWSTGNVGRLALHGIVQHPDLELAGVLVHSPDKAGKDAGELAGLPPIGVTATSDPDEMLALGADCVSYTATGDLRPDDAVADMAGILEAGTNVVATSVVPLVYPPSAPRRYTELLESACKAGDVSCFTSGIDPGFANGMRSLANPGSMPDVKHETSPALHALSSSSVYRRGADGGYTSGTTDVATTFVPASRMPAMSATASSGRRSPVAVYETQSAPRASISSGSDVAVTPIGGRPASSPASLPALSGLWTRTPASSRSGCWTMPWSASRPTFPVLHCTTRYVMPASHSRHRSPGKRGRPALTNGRRPFKARRRRPSRAVIWSIASCSVLATTPAQTTTPPSRIRVPSAIAGQRPVGCGWVKRRVRARHTGQGAARHASRTRSKA